MLFSNEKVRPNVSKKKKFGQNRDTKRYYLNFQQ